VTCSLEERNIHALNLARAAWIFLLVFLGIYVIKEILKVSMPITIRVLIRIMSFFICFYYRDSRYRVRWFICPFHHVYKGYLGSGFFFGFGQKFAEIGSILCLSTYSPYTQVLIF
jgi:hypothetical protein